MNRRHFLRGGLLLGMGGVGLSLQSQESNTSSPNLITQETDQAINSGLAYLASTQASDGSFPYQGGMGGGSNVAISALAGLALLAGGHAPGRGKYGQAVSRAADYILRIGSGSRPGFLQNSQGAFSHGSMYQHGFASLFLAELCGTLPDPERQKKVRSMLAKATNLTVGAQNREGGWRYEPQPTDADVSVTVAQLMALRAARNAGIVIGKNVVDKAVDYIKGCRTNDGGFCYQKGGQRNSAFPRSAASVVGLFSAGIYQGHPDYDYVERGLKYLMRFLPGGNNANIRQDHYFYGHYYAALAMWTAGGKYWSEWFPAIRDELINNKRTNGQQWIDLHGPAYATAMACIILQLPNNYLPIMQK